MLPTTGDNRQTRATDVELIMSNLNYCGNILISRIKVYSYKK